MTIHGTVIEANNNIIPRRIDENFGLGSDYAFTTLAASSNEITITSRTHQVTASDDIQTIEGGKLGVELTLQGPASGSATLTQGTYLQLASSPRTLNSPYDIIKLVCVDQTSGSQIWCEVSFSDNA